MIALAYAIIAIFTIVFFAGLSYERYSVGQLIFITLVCGLPIAQSILVLMGR